MKKHRNWRAGTAAKPGARVGLPRRGRDEGEPATRPEGARQTIHRLRLELAQARRQIEDLRASADRDVLLDIFNRRAFVRAVDRSIAYIKRYGATGALILLDVDHLKPINDTFGHAAGDKVLKAVARALTAQVRSSDVVGRLGGDEFGVLLWNLSAADADAKARSLEHAIDTLSFEFDQRTVHAGASAGIAILDMHADPARALEQADRAMYVRKAERRHPCGTLIRA
ncbi:GGDEF domain-containing protein [Bradyrhizobium sp. HKCCYLS1011]|uniref:GGDEF domain-containing protein n=1 Tax=Bradyrhizobium sp. HKCCYLS1011 TaxID=3420733 RepID=UPI003EB7DFF9